MSSAAGRRSAPTSPPPAGHRPPILVANGVRGFSHLPLPDAGTIARTYGWVVPVAPGSIHSWELPAFGARLDRAQSRLEQATDLFTVSAPTDAIAATRATGRVAGERLLILGGDAAVLLLGFAVLASTRLRRDQFAVRRRLTWFGARRSQILLVAATEVAVITLGATLVGWLVGSAVGAVFARHLDAPGLLAVQHSVLTGRALAIACALALLTGVVMLTALRTDAVAFGGVRVTVVDVAALGALGAVLLALARGKADATALSSGGTGVVLLSAPRARALRPCRRGGASSGSAAAGRRANGPARARAVAGSCSFRSRAHRAAVVLSIVFFVLSVGIALFAIAYRATLERGELEQARYAVPAPYVLQESLEQLVSVQQAAPAARYAALGRTTPVLRDSGYVLGNAGRDFTLLALPAAEITRLDGWRSDFAAQTPSELARLDRPRTDPASARHRTAARCRAR